MNIQTLTLGPLATNCYLVRAEESRRAVIIDPAANSKRLLAALEEQGLTLEAILLNARVYIGEADKDDPSHMCHDLLTYTDTYQDGDTVAAGGLTFQVLSTPGHTPGSVCLLCETVLFSGDTLFAGSYGRTDFLGGSSRDMAASLKRLSMLPPETRVLPGHGPSSTIEEELRTNPYLRGHGIE